jgi:hypothetical protein
MKKHLSEHEIAQRREAAHYAAQAIISALFPDKPIRRSGHEIRIGDNGGIAYDLHKRVYHNHKSGKGGDIFALIMEATGCGFIDAVKRAEEFAGGDYYHAPAMPEVKPEKKANDNRLNALRIWQYAKRIGASENPVTAYLQARGVVQ